MLRKKERHFSQRESTEGGGKGQAVDVAERVGWLQTHSENAFKLFSMRMASEIRDKKELTQVHVVGKRESQRGLEEAHEDGWMGVSKEKRLLEG